MKTELTGEDLAHFRENGYLVLPQAFNAEEVALMQHEADRILELIINSSLANGRKSGRLDILQTSTGPMVRKIQPINDLSLFLPECLPTNDSSDPCVNSWGTSRFSWRRS